MIDAIEEEDNKENDEENEVNDDNNDNNNDKENDNTGNNKVVYGPIADGNEKGGGSDGGDGGNGGSGVVKGLGFADCFDVYHDVRALVLEVSHAYTDCLID